MTSHNHPIDDFFLENTITSAAKGRKSYWESDYVRAAEAFVRLFEANPRAWWFALEALRSLRNTLQVQALPAKDVKILFSPNYVGNSYQSNLYSKQQEFGYTAVPVDTLTLDIGLASFTLAKGSVFHQHWLKELYWRATDLASGIKEIDRHVGLLKALRCFGIPIVWTLHNLIDHDASEMQAELCLYAIQTIADTSDVILIHTQRAGTQLSELCGKDLSEKYQLLAHPLYDDMLTQVSPHIPAEINTPALANRRVVVSAGMIRPYKGIPDLVDAFSKLSENTPDHKLHLIIAGHCSDQSVRQKLEQLPPTTRSLISFIPRKLTDAEMTGLITLADVCATPYRKVLTSGSFYLTTTFRKPTIAPNIGMFSEIMHDRKTGFIYDGSVDSLASTLLDVARLPAEELSRVGMAAYNENSEWTVGAASARLFEILGHLN
jgi:beta-1,4-mannosyltransferase